MSAHGAGSGGGILLACRTFLPSETTRLSADGGDVTINYNMGGGGGGRIAVWTGEISSENRARLIAGLPVIQGTLVVSGAYPGLSESQATVAGGEVVDAPERNGGDGTIVFLKILPPPGTLITVR